MRIVSITAVVTILFMALQTNAQEAMIVHPKSGAAESFNLADMQHFRFEGNNLVVKTSTTKTFALADVAKLTFGDAIEKEIETETTISTIENENLVIFPNPTTGQLTIVGAKYFSPSQTVQIYDMNGRFVEAFAGNSIDISHLTNGIYYICVPTTQGTIAKKIIKQ